MCNGTRLLCHGLFYEHIRCWNPNSCHAGRKTLLPRIKHKTIKSVRLLFVLLRKQFLVKLSFAISINKSQGQLYGALWRNVFQASTKILIKEWQLEGEDGKFTINVVFTETLLSQT